MTGYGGRQTTEECPEAILLMCIQENNEPNIYNLQYGTFMLHVYQ